MPVEGGERAAPNENGGALQKIRGGQLVATDELAAKQVDGFSLEETGLDLRAEVDLGAVAVVLGVLAAEPGDRLVGVGLGKEIAPKAKVDEAGEQKTVGGDGGAIDQAADETRIVRGGKAAARGKCGWPW